MLEEKILNDYKEAMKARDNIKSTMLSTIRAEMLNLAIAKKKDKCDDNDIISIFRKHAKQHDDSIDQFTKGNRLDLVEKEKKELEILKNYLPAELAPEVIKKVIDEAITATGAVGIRDMGKVIKEVNAQLAGKADGKTVSELVRERLSKPA
ncbi:MAG: GatB/YqeY domain-containing protein [Candidatus Omnitrophica bacterium]|nr:GatB/YqeY domain-containing protein [Candidatus Omnitrophota bacterium]